MDQQWRRFHLLFVLLTLWKHAIGYPGLNSQLNPRSLRYHKALSPRGFKSSSAALMTKNIPLDVHSNVAASGTYKSVSQTQSSPTGSVSASLLVPQNLQGLDGLSTPLQFQGSNVKGMAGQSVGGPGSNSQFDFTYKYRTGPQAGGQLVSAQGGSGFSQAFPETFSAPFVLGQSSNERLSSSSSQTGSDLQLGGMSSQLLSQGSGAAQFLGASSQHAPGSPAHAKLLSSSGRFPSQVTSRQGSPSWFTSTSKDSSTSKVSASSSPVVSAQGGSASFRGLSSQSRSTSSQYSPVSGFGPSGEKASDSSLGSGSQGGSSQFAASHLSGLAQGVRSHPVGSYVQSQGSPGQLAFGSPQYASVSMAAARTTSSQYNQGSAKSLYSTASMASPQAVSGQYRQTTDGALSSIQSSLLQPSVSSSSQGSQSFGAAWSQSRFSVPSASAPSKSLASSGRLSQSASASLYSSASMPSPQSGSSRYSQATGSALSQSQAPQRWQPSASLSSQGYQTSSTTVSQSSSQGAKFPSRFSLASGSGPSQLVSTHGASSYGGLAQSSSSSAQYAPAYSKPASSPLGVKSQFTRGQSLYASSSQSTAGGTLGSSIRHASAHREVGSIASLQPQVASGQYAPRPSLDVKVPVYRHDSISGSSMSSRLQSQTWQPTTSRRVHSSFPTSGAAATQTSISPQIVQSSSRSSSVAGGTSRLFTQSKGSYTGLSQSLGSVGQYTPGSPAYTKFGASFGVSSQSTSGQSSSRQYSPVSTTGAGGQLISSSGFLSVREDSGSVGSSLQSQGVFAKEVPAPMDTSISVPRQTAAVSSGNQVFGASLQTGSSASSSLSSSQALSAPVDSVPQSEFAISHVSPFGHPSGSVTQSSGSSVQAASEGVSSSKAQTLRESAGFGSSVERQGMSVLSGSYDSLFGQSAPVSKPSRSSLGGNYGFKG